MPGVVWAGTDDGNLQVSRDGGATFTEVGKNHAGAAAEPPVLDLAHRRVALRRRARRTSSVDGHRSDDLKPYVFVTHDYGKTFQSITGNLPAFGNVQVVREDPKNKDLLYVGTEFGLFISLDARQELAEVHEQLSDGAHRRHPHPSARQRPDRRDARPQRLDRRRHHAAAAADAGGARRRTRRSSTSVRRSRGCNDQQHDQQVGGQKSVHRRERAARRGDQLLPEVGRDAATSRSPSPTSTAASIRTLDGTEDGRHQPRDVEPRARSRPRAGGGGGFGGGRGGGGAVEPGTYIVTLDGQREEADEATHGACRTPG